MKFIKCTFLLPTKAPDSETPIPVTCVVKSLIYYQLMIGSTILWQLSLHEICCWLTQSFLLPFYYCRSLKHCHCFSKPKLVLTSTTCQFDVIRKEFKYTYIIIDICDKPGRIFFSFCGLRLRFQVRVWWIPGSPGAKSSKNRMLRTRLTTDKLGGSDLSGSSHPCKLTRYLML